MDRKISRRQAFGLMGAVGASSLITPRIFADEPHVRDSTVSESETTSAGQGGGFYKFKIGSLDCALISDGGFTGQPKSLFPAVEPEDIESAARESFISAESIPMHINALLIQNGNENILIDTGCGPNFGETAGKLTHHLQLMGLTPDSISHIIISHAHGDHFGGHAAFTKAGFFSSKTEHDFWTGSADLSTSRLPDEAKKRMAEGAKSFYTKNSDRIELIDGTKEVAKGVSLVPAPGHTPGHCAVQISSGSEQLMYWSDTLHIQSLQISHPEFQIMFDVDPTLAEKTRRAMLERVAGERMMVSGSHLSFPALGYIKKRGSGYEFVPTIWQW